MSIKRKVACILALAMLLCLAGCKGKDEPAMPSQRPDMEVLKKAKVGSYILFGEYEQDYDDANGKEAVEWLVLDKQDDKMLVISRYGLDGSSYNSEFESTTWETCSLREWLNDTFYEKTFIPEEKSVIIASTVTADKNPDYGTTAGNDTIDKVFLLSIDEARRYFTDDDARACKGTPFCYACQAQEAENGNCYWWLRSPGSNSSFAADVDDSGSVVSGGYFVVNFRHAVRPAMWLNLTP